MIRLDNFAAVRANLDACAFSTYPLVVAAVVLRLWCRVHERGRTNLGWDDAVCVLALSLHSAFFFTAMLGLRQWLGKHVGTEVSLPHLVDFLRYLFAAQLLYTTCITANKATILAFYWRLFSVRSRTTILVVTGAVVAWFVAVILCVIFSCIPVSAAWDISITNAKCISTRDLWIGGSVVNVLTDIALLVLPIPFVWKLNAPLAQRLALVGMFGLGIFICVVSIVRLSVLLSIDLTSGDATFNFSEVVIWSVVEVNCGLICACLPSLRPAVRALGLGRLFGVAYSENDHASGSRLPPGTGNSELKPYPTRSRKGIFSTSAADHSNTTTFAGHDEEDSYAMIEHSKQTKGMTTTSVEPAKSSMSEDRPANDLHMRIEIKRDWAISGEPVYGRRGI